jgi:hypothetical protein
VGVDRRYLSPESIAVGKHLNQQEKTELLRIQTVNLMVDPAEKLITIGHFGFLKIPKHLS